MPGPMAAGGLLFPPRAAAPSVRVRFLLAGRALDLTTDDAALIAEAATVLGRPQPAEGASPADLQAEVTLAGGFAQLHLRMTNPEHLSPADLLLAAGSADFPFALLEAEGPRAVFSRRGESTPALLVNGGECRLAQLEGWRKALSLLLLQRVMRSRDDALFFHAASLAVRGRGLLLVGAKGAGKSTLALALAARGHALLGDENACVLVESATLLPFRRPLGVKPGPRAAAVERALFARGLSPERDGMMRLAVESLFDAALPEPAPLAAIVFLAGFAPATRLLALDPGRTDVGRLQPVGASMVNAPPARRAFEMARLLAGSRVFELVAGPPDEAASALEEAVPA